MNKTLWRVTLLAGLLVGGVLACTRTPAAQGAEQSALESAIHRWMTAVNAQDVTTLTATMTEDVELSDNVATVRGREAAIRALRDAVKDGPLSGVTFEVTIANDVAWHEIGLTQTQKGDLVQGRGRALEIWKRVNGEWKLHRRMTTGAPAPEVSVTRPSTKEPVLDRPKE
jgi:ketosteroid isomerase-like protein